MADYYAILTNTGKALEAAAIANGTKITLIKFVVGDGSGQAQTPDPARTALVHEVYRNSISDLTVSTDQPNQIIAQLVMPANVGGFTVREIGLLTDKGELYAIANCATFDKPVNGVSITMQFRLAVSETDNVTLNVATGEGLFLRQDANLSDVKDKQKARQNLQLGTAATKDVGVGRDNVMGVSEFGTNNFAARMGISRVITGANLPTSPGVWSAENSAWAGVPWGSVFCTTNGSDLSTTGGSGRFNHYLQISHEEAGKPGLRVAVNINGAFSGWERVYTTAYKPTAADVGAVASKNGTASMLHVTDELLINANAKLYRDGGKLFIEARYDNGTEPSYFSFSPGDGTFRSGRGYFDTDIRIGGESIRIYKENNGLWFNVSGKYFGFQNDGVLKADRVFENNLRVYSPNNPQPPNTEWATVGSYAYAMWGSTGSVDFNNIVSGSNLYPSGSAGSAGGATLPGSWRCMGIATTVNDAYRSTLWMRVS